MSAAEIATSATAFDIIAMAVSSVCRRSVPLPCPPRSSVLPVQDHRAARIDLIRIADANWIDGHDRARRMDRRSHRDRRMFDGSHTFMGWPGRAGWADSGGAILPIFIASDRTGASTSYGLVVRVAPIPTSTHPVQTCVSITQRVCIIDKARRDKKCKRQSRKCENPRRFGSGWLDHRGSSLVRYCLEMATGLSSSPAPGAPRLPIGRPPNS